MPGARLLTLCWGLGSVLAVDGHAPSLLVEEVAVLPGPSAPAPVAPQMVSPFPFCGQDPESAGHCRLSGDQASRSSPPQVWSLDTAGPCGGSQCGQAPGLPDPHGQLRGRPTLDSSSGPEPGGGPQGHLLPLLGLCPSVPGLLPSGSRGDSPRGGSPAEAPPPQNALCGQRVLQGPSSSATMTRRWPGQGPVVTRVGPHVFKGTDVPSTPQPSHLPSLNCGLLEGPRPSRGSL